jgi:hypothetical protein
MKKILLIFLIFFLILFTAVVKNSTKRIDDKIFVTKESIRGLKKDFENIKLEHDYLSSAEKLLEFQSLYFDDELEKKNLDNIKVIKSINNNIIIENFRFISE